MRSTWFTRAARVAFALAVVATTVSVAPAAAKPKPGVKRSGLNLFSATFGFLTVNRQYCPIINTGEVCTDPSGNGVIEGSFWPKGTPDSYIFNSGLQIAASIPTSAGFAWAGDTVGAFFMDPRGDQADGAPVTNVFSSLDLDDQVNWPTPDGTVADTSVYASVLLGRNSVSQQDIWFRAWDGNPGRLGGRVHPMGVLVETRGMAWNYPTGNEDILYFVYTFTNVTSANEADYNNASNPNNILSYRANLAALGAQFQQLNNAQFGITIPAGGYELDSMYAAFFMDCDVGTNAGANYSTVVVPFNMSGCYESSFNDPTWTAAGSFTPDIFGPPFAAAPGMVGVKYLRSPKDSLGKELGLRMFSNTLNSGTGYPDPVGIKQMLRYISGFSDPAKGDNPCTNQGKQLQLKYCYLAQVLADTRFFQSSGPFKLKAGESKTIVVAYANAAPVNTPFLQTQLGGDFKPGLPATGDSIALNPGAVREIEKVFGWAGQSDTNNDVSIEQYEVNTVPRSLLNKGLVAQAVFDGKFLLPFAPEPPQFFLIPGDNQVTVVWQRSNTEKVGDPFFALASNPSSALYDPNFRQIDVEGYRIYRGRTSGALQLIAQFDYAGTTMTDFTGGFAYVNCAPELGVQTGCPITFDFPATPASPGNPVPLVGDVIQVPPAGRVKLADGSIFIVKADTAVTGGNSGFPALTDNGVSFAYVDRSVRDLFQYYYAVTAFDVNSVKSGPTSLESPRSTKAVTPRTPGSSAATVGQLGTLKLLAANGTALNTAAALPSIDPTTGEFSGPMPPTDALGLGFAAFLPELVDSGTLVLTLDSVTPGINAVDYGLALPATYFFRAASGGAVDTFNIPLQVGVTAEDASANANFPGAHVKQAKGSIFGGDSTFSLLAQTTITSPGPWRLSSPGRGAANSSPSNSDFTGIRWWGGAANENTANPTNGLCRPAVGTCITTAVNAASGHIGGAIPGVTAVLPVQGYSTVRSVPGRDMETMTSTVYRAADFNVYWGAAGVVDSVIDVTHGIPVPFNSKLRASWGILDSTSFVGMPDDPDGSVSVLTWSDVICVDPLNDDVSAVFGAGCATAAPMKNTAHLGSISTGTGGFRALTATTGQGFIFYLAGKFTMMQMAALPSNTVWHARYFAGNIQFSGGVYDFVEASSRPATVPGLRASISFTGSSPVNLTATSNAQLALVHTVPDPYYVTNALEITPNNKVLKFVNLPARAIIRIYSVSGVLVQVLTHNDVTGGGEQAWDLRNRSNQFIASGVYFYHVEAADGKTKIGRFTVVQFAP